MDLQRDDGKDCQTHKSVLWPSSGWSGQILGQTENLPDDVTLVWEAEELLRPGGQVQHRRARARGEAQEAQEEGRGGVVGGQAGWGGEHTQLQLLAHAGGSSQVRRLS